MDTNIKKTPIFYWVSIGIFVILTSAISYLAWYGYNYLEKLSGEIDDLASDILVLENQMASSTEKLQNDISQSHSDLSSAIDNEKKNVGDIEARLGDYQKEVSDISGTVNVLEILTKVDPELLQKYSKVFFLNEHYSPERLIEIPDNYEYDETRYSKLDSQVWPYLEKMLKASLVNNQEIYIFSAYRSFDEQNALKSYYSVTYGEGTANQFSADQGYSEHQLGTAVDLITTGIGGTLEGFEDTEEYQWLLNNAYKYGFILSYPDDNEYYVYEPWHWRFVGIKLATDLHNDKKNFYDLDQREIDEYLVNLFE